MFIDNFTNRALSHKTEYVKKNGAFLIGRVGKIYVYNLYELHGFYVEIAWEIKSSKLVGVDAFYSTKRLDSYLKRIQLDALRKNFN